MNSAKALLPPGFETLRPYLNLWAVSGTTNRAERRLQSTEPERLSFYNAAKDLVPGALALLDQKPLQQLDEQEKTLMDLLLSFCHVALAVEIQGDMEDEQADARRHMKIVKSSADVRP